MPKRTAEPASVPLLARIVSGGQTGADRGGLDAARALGLEHGGWCPKGRRAEDGLVPARYRLHETPTSLYRERTVWNVRDSDGTLLFTRGAAVGGSRITLEAARRLRRPRLHLDLDRIAADPRGAAQRLRTWLVRRRIRSLNVAGVRASQVPAAQARVRQFLIRSLRRAR